MSIQFGQRLHHAKSAIPPEGWLKFRKYDGHSVIWLPSSGLWSLGRSNKPEKINAPESWISNLPNYAIHGELWHESDNHDIITSYTKDIPVDSEWEELKLICFAFPADNGEFDPDNEITYSGLNNDISWEESRKKVVENSVVALPDTVETCNESWEGLVFQNPKAVYRNGRTWDCLKYKPVYEDTATVVGYASGKTGDRIGTTASIIVEYVITEKLKSVHGGNVDGHIGDIVKFKVSGLNECEWDNAEEHFPIGSELDFNFLSLSNKNTPMHCSINRG